MRLWTAALLLSASLSLYAMVATNLVGEKTFLPIILLIVSIAAFALMSLELSAFGKAPRTRWVASREVPPPVDVTAIWPTDEAGSGRRWTCKPWAHKVPPARNDP